VSGAADDVGNDDQAILTLVRDEHAQMSYIRGASGRIQRPQKNTGRESVVTRDGWRVLGEPRRSAATPLAVVSRVRRCVVPAGW
jgi:hypothetical protein